MNAHNRTNVRATKPKLHDNGFLQALTQNPFVLLLLFGICATVVFYPSISGSFIFDDPQYVQFNPYLNSLNKLLSWNLFWIQRPLYWLSFFIEKNIWGNNPAVFRTTNLIAHVAASFFLFRFTREIAKVKNLEGDWFPFFASFLFLVSPLTTEAVAYISARNNSVGGFFFILGHWWFIRFIVTEPHSRKIRLAVYSIVSLVVAFLFKEIYVVSLISCALLYWWLRPKNAGIKSRNKVIAVALAAVFILSFMVLFVPYKPFPRVKRVIKRTLFQGDTSAIATNSYAIAYSFRLFAWPDHLNIDHDLPVLDSIGDPRAYLSIIGLALFGFILFLFRKKLPLALASYLGYLLLILPSNSIILRRGDWMIDPLSERNLYAPAMFFSILLVHVISSMIKRRSFRLAILVILVAALGARTFARSSDFRSDIALWTSAAKYSPNRARVQYNLALALKDKGKNEQAKRHARRVIQLSPQRIDGYHLLSNIQKTQGNLRAAEQTLHQGLRHAEGDLSLLWFQLGQNNYELGRNSAAQNAMRRALAIDPDYLVPRIVLVYLLLQKGNMEQARHHVAKLQQSYSRLKDAFRPKEFLNEHLEARYFFALGWYQMNNGQTETGIRSLNHAIELNPQMIEPYMKLGDYYYRTKQYLKSWNYFIKAIRIPDSERYKDQLVPYLENLKKLMDDPTIDPALL